jgi:hypothetical protein
MSEENQTQVAHDSASKGDGVLGIFLSYKSRMAKYAQQIRSRIEYHGGNIKGKTNIQVYVADQVIKPGTPWRQDILKSLRSSDLLILLYTGDDERFDWSFYETGFFEGATDQHRGHTGTPERPIKKGLIVLHDHETQPPDPLSHWQSISINSTDTGSITAGHKPEGNVVSFVRDLLRPYNPAILEEENRKHLQEVIDALIDPFRPRALLVHQARFLKEITISLKQEAIDTVVKTTGIPDDADVVGSAECMKLFGLRQTRVKWARLKDRVRALDETMPVAAASYWMSYLNDLVRHVASWPDEIVSTGLPLVRFPSEEETVYRPCLAEMQGKGDTYWFNVAFIDLPRELDPPAGEFGTVSQLLTIARMLRFGVLLPLRTALSERKGAAELVAALRHGMSALRTVYVESVSRGLRKPEDVTGLFPDSRVQERVQSIIRDWVSQYANLETAAVGTGAVSAVDVEEARRMRGAAAESAGGQDVADVSGVQTNNSEPSAQAHQKSFHKHITSAKAVVGEMLRLNLRFYYLASREFHEKLEAMVKKEDPQELATLMGLYSDRPLTRQQANPGADAPKKTERSCEAARGSRERAAPDLDRRE